MSRDDLRRVRDAADRFARAGEQAAIAGAPRNAARLYKAALMMLLSGPGEAIEREGAPTEDEADPEKA
jgi:hypothetical protein